MAFKGKHYQVASSVHLIEAIKDFLITCDWTLEGPTATPTDRQNQDDEHAHILGWFLHSVGEDGQQDLNLHMVLGKAADTREPQGIWDYLQDAGGVDDLDTTFTVASGHGSNYSAGQKFKIGDEIVEIGTVSGDQLINCLRGRNGTLAASHAQYDVLIKVTGSYPFVNLYPFRDLANPIAQSSGTGFLGFDTTSGTLPGLGVYTAQLFAYATYVKIRDGSEAGKLRPILSDPGDGSLVYSPFLTAPGDANVDLISVGFFPPCSRKQQVGVYSDYKAPVPYALVGDEITDVYIYGSKDGFALLGLTGTTWYVWYWGKYTPLASPLVTTVTSDVSSGSTLIPVGNTDIFTKDGKYRILAQSVDDWKNNWDQSLSTYMGATGSGEWYNLDADEIAQECFMVDSIDAGAGTITTTLPLCYNYKAGAVIGEDPRPMVGVANNQGDGGNVRYTLDDGSAVNALAVPFHVAAKTAMLSTHPCHRRRDRCGDSGLLPPGGSRAPWECDGGRDTFNQIESSAQVLLPATSNMLDNKEFNTDRLPLIPYVLMWNRGYEDSKYNTYSRSFGVLPLMRKMYDNLGAASQDTIRVLWNGKYETFRIFSVPDDSGTWIAVGPEIA